MGGGGAVSEDPSFNSVGERNPWSCSLRQCVFSKPEGEVGQITQRPATGGLRTIQVFLENNQKHVGVGAGRLSCNWFRSDPSKCSRLWDIPRWLLDQIQVEICAQSTGSCVLVPFKSKGNYFSGPAQADVFYQYEPKEMWIEFVTKVG